ncbi:MAG: hypothetical protein KF688_13915 [Pirellulales bacterium]|nr:hypothetical protein [Pirellulales bacterium]
MKMKSWRRRWAATLAGGSLALGAGPLLAVEMANITVVDGAIPEVNLPAVSIDPGQATPNFFVDPALGVGVYPVRIGEDSTDDFFNGVLLTTIRENHARANSLGQQWFVANSVALADAHSPTSAPSNGTFRVIVDAVGSGNGYGTSGVANADVAAVYFPFSEGWIGGTTRSSANGGNPNAFSSLNGIALADITTPFSALYYLDVPGVEDSRRQGLVFANHAKNEDNYAAVAPSADGNHFVVSIHHSNAGNLEADPFAFVYVPFGTPNVTMASVHGASGLNEQPTVMNSSGSAFTIVREGAGTYRLSIPGQSPTSGTLLMNSGGTYALTGGYSQTSRHLITHQADGNDWIIQTTDMGNSTTPSFAQTPAADRGMAFQFAFMPFSAPPTGPGANPVVESFKDKVLGFNVDVVEYDGSLNDVPGLGGSVTSGTAGYRFDFLRQNRGDFSVAIDGAFPALSDGILFASVNQGLRDNSLTGGERAYGMIAAGDAGGGWEFATHIADPGLGVASSVEFNVNFSAVLIGGDTPFHKAANAAQSGGQLNVSLPGVNALSDGVLVAQVWGNNDDYAVATPASDGSGWAVTTYDNNTGQSNMTVNWLYLPYTAENLVAGRVTTDGDVLASTNPAGFTLVKEAPGTYLLTIPGKTPADGTLLLTPEETGGLNDNVLVYDTAPGGAFRIFGVDMVSYEEKSDLIFPTLEDTNFTFAFIDHNAAPILGGSYLEADFNQDGSVDAADLAAWQGAYGDGARDGSDFLTWQRQYNGASATASTAAVPEPAAWGLAAVAGAALVGRRRRR